MKKKKRPNKRRKWRTVMMALCFAMGAYLAVCFVLARSYLAPQRHVPKLPDGLAEVTVPLPDGLTDPSWVTPKLDKGEPSKVVFVFAHGYGGSRDSWSELMPRLAAKGIDSIAPAMPAQDASPEPQVGFGFREADTMVAAANWVRKRAPGTKIVYAGVSMGGAAAWLASEKDPSAVGVVSEGAYARFDEAMYHWFERKAVGASYYLRPVIWMASSMSGLNPGDVVPLDAARKWKGKPALVIQAGDDNLIVRSHADRLSEASGAPLWVVPGAEHAGCFEVAGKEYLEKLVAFAATVSK